MSNKTWTCKYGSVWTPGPDRSVRDADGDYWRVAGSGMEFYPQVALGWRRWVVEDNNWLPTNLQTRAKAAVEALHGPEPMPAVTPLPSPEPEAAAPQGETWTASDGDRPRQYDGWTLAADGLSMVHRYKLVWAPERNTGGERDAILAYLQGKPGPWTNHGTPTFVDADGAHWTHGREVHEVLWHNDMEPSCQYFRVTNGWVEYDRDGVWLTDTGPVVRVHEVLAHFNQWRDPDGMLWYRQDADTVVGVGDGDRYQATVRSNRTTTLFSVESGESWDSGSDFSEGWERDVWERYFAKPVAQTTALEGRKDDSEKNRVDLLPFDALEEVAQILSYGARKYGAYNWAKGMAWHRVFGALMRHMWAWWRGEAADPETGRSHLAHAACCVLFLLTYELRKVGTDDRPI